LLEVLGVQPLAVQVSYGAHRGTYLLELVDEAAVRAAAPDFAALKAIEAARAVILTSQAEMPGHDFVSRFFAPRMGVPEDPVTGSAHTVLAPYWAARLGKTRFHAFQASQRGGELRLALAGERVLIAGQAVTVWRGELTD
jgi:PhzF family phenazine biosynthesis protein